ncbi:MAG: hypothetical protein WEB00_08205 [Dehalococcoidia bacterium]
MRRLRMGLCAAVLISVCTAACSGDDDDDEPAEPTTATANAEAEAEAEAGTIAFYRFAQRDDIGIVDLSGGEPTILTQGSELDWLLATRGVDWSPDGQWLVYGASRANGPGAERLRDIYVMRPDGSDLRAVTNVGDAAWPAWTADGESIVFSRLASEDTLPHGELWLVTLQTGETRQLTENLPGVADVLPSASPTGDVIAFSRVNYDEDGPGARPYIYTLDLDGGEPELLIEDALEPDFSPDGSRLAYVSRADQNGSLTYGEVTFFAAELYVANADGSDPQRLTQTFELNEGHPTWVGEQRLVFQRGEKTGDTEASWLLEINADGTCEREVLADATLGVLFSAPSWRPSESPPPIDC